jgi:hypothetical protein
LEFYGEHGLIAHNPSIVTGGKEGNISGFALNFGAIIHPDL